MLQRLLANRRLATWIPRLLIVLCVLLYVVHLGFVASHAVDVPFWDEWDFLHPTQADALRWPSLEVLFWHHNEHMLVPTRLQVWALYHLDGWNLATQQIMNFVLFGGLVSWIGWLCRDLSPERSRWAWLAVFPFLLSPLGWENHCWGFQSQFHLALLGFTVAAWALLRDRLRPEHAIVGVAFALLAVTAQSAGVAAVLVLAPFVILFASRRWRAAPRDERRGTLLWSAIVAVGLGLALAVWFAGYPGRLPNNPESTWPWRPTFWAYFLNLISFGFGVTRRSVWLALPFALIVATPLIGHLVRRRGRVDRAFWTLLALETGVLGILAAVTVGRADADLAGAKTSRYFLFASPLIPFTAVAWQTWLTGIREDDRLPRLVAGAWLAVVCGATFADDWGLFGKYAEVARERREGLARIAAYYRGEATTDVPLLYPQPLGPERLAEAKRLGVSFVRRLEAGGD